MSSWRRRSTLSTGRTQSNKPFFVWFNATRMHFWTHVKPESEVRPALGSCSDGMVEHDGHVGQLLKKLDDLGIADQTYHRHLLHR